MKKKTVALWMIMILGMGSVLGAGGCGSKIGTAESRATTEEFYPDYTTDFTSTDEYWDGYYGATDNSLSTSEKNS